MQQRSGLLSTSTAQSTQHDPHEPSSIPPWVHVNDGNEDPDTLLLPSQARPNTRHYKPPPTHYKPGRKWDHLRTAEPPLLSAPINDHQLRWAPFMQSGPNPQNREGRVVDAAWMEENMPYMNPEWHPDDEEEPAPGLLTARGMMYRGKWLISPERQEKTMRLFWVSQNLVSPRAWAAARYDCEGLSHFAPTNRYILLRIFVPAYTSETGPLVEWLITSGRNDSATGRSLVRFRHGPQLFFATCSRRHLFGVVVLCLSF